MAVDEWSVSEVHSQADGQESHHGTEVGEASTEGEMPIHQEIYIKPPYVAIEL